MEAPKPPKSLGGDADTTIAKMKASKKGEDSKPVKKAAYSKPTKTKRLDDDDDKPLVQPKKKPAKAAEPKPSKRAADDDDDDKPLVQPKKKAKPALPVVVAKSRLRPSMGSIARRQQRVKEKTNKRQKTTRRSLLQKQAKAKEQKTPTTNRL